MRHLLLITGILCVTLPACLSTGRQAATIGDGSGQASGTAANQQAGVAIADSTTESGERAASPSSAQMGGINFSWQTGVAGAGGLALILYAVMAISADRQETRRMMQMLEALTAIALARDGVEMVALWLDRPTCGRCRRRRPARMPEKMAA